MVSIESPIDYEAYNSMFKNKSVIHLTQAVSSVQGTRKTMEDAHQYIPDMNHLISTPYNPHSYFAVFDGHSGREAALFCEKNLHHIITSHPKYLQDIRQALHESFMNADAQFFKECIDPDSGDLIYDAGCTAVVGIIQGNLLTVANVGDSRAVLAEGGKSVGLTLDQKASRPDEKERIEAAGGHVRRAHPGGILRVEGRLAVSRAIGDFKYKMGEMVVSPDPEISQFRLDSNSDFIIAACDGLWDVFSREEAVRITYNNLLETRDVQKTCDRLVREALETGSTDNITCQIILLHDLL